MDLNMKTCYYCQRSLPEAQFYTNDCYGRLRARCKECCKKPPLTTLERFMRKVRILDNGCWEWLGARTPYGYGNFGWEGHNGMGLSHRFAYESLIGKVPKGKELDHLCKNKWCVNPKHLEPVTHQENMMRGYSSDYIKLRRRLKARCPHGHLFTKNNTKINYRGARVCKTCEREGRKRWGHKSANLP
jgi:hypothetical protein